MISLGNDIKNLSIREVHEKLLKKEFRVRDLVHAYQNEIEKRNGEIHAYLEVFDDVDAQIKKAEEMFAQGTATLLTGVPIAVKDNILIRGKKATAASKVLSDFVSPYDATVISLLKEQGVIFLGRTNMDEFAMGSSTENSAFGITRNPKDTTRVPGGSSGGSAAAVAMEGALAALGSDTGGSVRQPASFCGCVGLKPTYGAVSRFGLIALGSSLDQIGPITKNVDDARIIFEAIRGTDKHDSTSFYPKITESLPEKFTIGVPRHLLELEGLHSEVKENYERTISFLQKEGHTIVDVTLPNVAHSLAVYYIVMPAEASSNLARFDGVKYGLKIEGDNLMQDYLLTRREGFGKETRRRIMLGAYVLSSGYYDAYYAKAIKLKELIKKDFDEALKTAHVIMMPTTPTPAFKIGEKSADPLEMYLADVFTVPANITGHPALSVPSGATDDTNAPLPLGMQFITKEYGENLLFAIGEVIEKQYGRR